MKTNVEFKKPIGLLYDSVNNNTGDIAIGIALSDYLKKKRIPHKIVDPFSFSPDDYEFLIIGGGFLLRDEGDSFYDRFRVPGRHVLMSMGTATSENLSYLEDYRKVTVRSSADKTRLLANTSGLEVEIVPCITLTLQKANVLPADTNGMIGIHFVADTLTSCDGFDDILNSLPQTKAVLPFTFYNKDSDLMRRTNLVGDYIFLDEYDPRTIFGLIGNMSAVIVSSLHATIFAYANGIPFLTMHQEKVQEFLDDRDLGHLSFKNSEELKEKLHFLTEDIGTNPFKQSFDNDLATIEKCFDDLLSNITGKEIKDFSSSKDQEITASSQLDRSKLQTSLLQTVVSHRDALIGELHQRVTTKQRKIIELESELAIRDLTYSAKLMKFERRIRRFLKRGKGNF